MEVKITANKIMCGVWNCAFRRQGTRLVQYSKRVCSHARTLAKRDRLGRERAHHWTAIACARHFPSVAWGVHQNSNQKYEHTVRMS